MLYSGMLIIDSGVKESTDRLLHEKLFRKRVGLAFSITSIFSIKQGSRSRDWVKNLDLGLKATGSRS